MTKSDTRAEIIAEVPRAFEDLGAEDELLTAILAWGRTLSDRDMLDRLRRHNATTASVERVMHSFD